MRRRHWRAPSCSSGKVGYRTQGRALHAVALMRSGHAQSVAAAEARPVGVYRCGCGAWHMTTQVYPSTVMAP